MASLMSVLGVTQVTGPHPNMKMAPMHDRNEKQPGNIPSFVPEEMVSASELKDWIYCNYSWMLNQHGFQVIVR
jgi:hypothetical protein